MKILYVCHRFPFPPNRGGKIRPFNMIRHLSERHQVTVASLVRSEEEHDQGRGLENYCEKILWDRIGPIRAVSNMLARVPTAEPSSFGYFHSRDLATNISDEIKRGGYDCIFVHCSSMAGYVAHIRGIPKILDFGDMDSQKWRIYSKIKSFPLSLVFHIEWKKLERLERKMAQQFDCCTCTTQLELDTLRSFSVPCDTDWFPNGVDTDFFSPGTGDYDPDLVSFIGRMDYFPNQRAVIWFCDHVWPLLRKERGQAKLVIVGANPPAPIRSLGDRPGIKVTGSVPDVRPFVAGSAVNIAPLDIARGTQNKILEAMAMGVPVVASGQACRGVDAIAGEHILQAEDKQEWADRILDVMRDQGLRSKLSMMARERVVGRHSWEASLGKMDRIIERTVDRFRI